VSYLGHISADTRRAVSPFSMVPAGPGFPRQETGLTPQTPVPGKMTG